MSANFDNTSNTIDSRDVIARIEELEAELTTEYEQYEEEYLSKTSEAAGGAPEYEDWLMLDDTFEKEELITLKKLADQAESSPDWLHGEQLINAEYFTQYIEELINDCYEMPKEINSGEWPWRHVTIDYEAAAEEAKQDYMEVDFNGNTFLIRA